MQHKLEPQLNTMENKIKARTVGSMLMARLGNCREFMRKATYPELCH